MDTAFDYQGEDLTGREFGQWKVLGFHARLTPQRIQWLCRCSCGTERPVEGSNLKYNRSKSCGCANQLPDLFRSPERAIWQGMVSRCKSHPNYAGRGIKVCQRWKKSFVDFYSDMGPRPEDRRTIDRIDNDGHYSCGKCEECQKNGWPANCRWANMTQQARNRRNNRKVKFLWIPMVAAELAERCGIPHASVVNRLDDGWTEEEIFEWANGINSRIIEAARMGLGAKHPREINEAFSIILELASSKVVP